MSAQRNSVTMLEPIAPRPPVLREGQSHCPRCGGLLLRDYEDLSCIACSYSYTVIGRLDSIRPRLAA